MATLNEQLAELQAARDSMKTVLEGKGQAVTKDIRTYADFIDNKLHVIAETWDDLFNNSFKDKELATIYTDEVGHPFYDGENFNEYQRVAYIDVLWLPKDIMDLTNPIRLSYIDLDGNEIGYATISAESAHLELHTDTANISVNYILNTEYSDEVELVYVEENTIFDPDIEVPEHMIDLGVKIKLDETKFDTSNESYTMLSDTILFGVRKYFGGLQQYNSETEEWLNVENQFTATSEDLPPYITAMGKDGVIEGNSNYYKNIDALSISDTIDFGNPIFNFVSETSKNKTLNSVTDNYYPLPYKPHVKSYFVSTVNAYMWSNYQISGIGYNNINVLDYRYSKDHSKYYVLFQITTDSTTDVFLVTVNQASVIKSCLKLSTNFIDKSIKMYFNDDETIAAIFSSTDTVLAYQLVNLTDMSSIMNTWTDTTFINAENYTSPIWNQTLNCFIVLSNNKTLTNKIQITRILTDGQMQISYIDDDGYLIDRATTVTWTVGERLYLVKQDYYYSIDLTDTSENLIASSYSRGNSPTFTDSSHKFMGHLSGCFCANGPILYGIMGPVTENKIANESFDFYDFTINIDTNTFTKSIRYNQGVKFTTNSQGAIHAKTFTYNNNNYMYILNLDQFNSPSYSLSKLEDTNFSTSGGILSSSMSGTISTSGYSQSMCLNGNINEYVNFNEVVMIPSQSAKQRNQGVLVSEL